MGSIQRRIGEGRTAEVLRNLCYQVYEQKTHWDALTGHMKSMFGVELLPPDYLVGRGELRMSYKDQNDIMLDLSASGRGMQQILLLLAYMYLNPFSVLLLDEPDAHLEILRQRQIYQLLTDVAKQQGAQIIAASHSEVILNEAADRDIVVAFVGKPHRIDDRSRRSQVMKALKEIGFEQYYQAEQIGWVLYLEGATDLAILRAFAKTLQHEAEAFLDTPFVHYVANQPQKAREHFYAVREAKEDLIGVALFDRLDRDLQSNAALQEGVWRRREIENYLGFPDVLIAYAEQHYSDSGRGTMQSLIADYVPPIALRDMQDKYWVDTKISDDFLDRVFAAFFQRLGLPNLLRKTDYHVLAGFVPREMIDPEVTEKLDLIVAVAQQAKPRED